MKLTFKFKTLALSALVALGCVSAKAQIFYKVEKPGSDKVSYLLGTHHFAPVEILDSLKDFKSALASVDKVYGEIDMALMSNPAELMKYQSVIMAPADSTLDKILTPAELDSVQVVWNRISKGQMPLSLMYAMKPATLTNAMIALLMAEHFPEKDMQAPGLDQTVQDLAKAGGKEVGGLESMDFQMKMLYGKPISIQKEDLLESVENGGADVIDKTLTLTDAYMARDLKKMAELMEEEDESLEELVFARNENWTKLLKEEFDVHPVMVVVGAGHLPMERGLIDLLTKEGYTVTPIE